MNRIARGFAWTVATWFGCGAVPLAPGTMGTVGAIPLYLLAARGGQFGVAATAVGITLLGVWASTVVSRDLGKKDPQNVVVDEVAGFLVTILPARTVSLPTILAAFVLFRVFDSLKPGPIRRLESLPEGWGIVMDDIGAGVLGAIVLFALLALHVLPG